MMIENKIILSKYKGVIWHKGYKKWQAVIKVNGKNINLGKLTSERLAAMLYDRAVAKHFGKNVYYHLYFGENAHYNFSQHKNYWLRVAKKEREEREEIIEVNERNVK